MNPISAIRDFFRYLTYPFRLLARLPASIISSPGRFLGMTLPTRVSLVVAFSLLIVSIIYFILKLNMEDGIDLRDSLGNALIVLVLIIATALVARVVVKTWLEKDYSRFPEIDQAWNAGVSALKNQGVEIVDTPLFLILGTGSKHEADALFRAAGLPLCVDGEPFEKGWLHWYATPEAIYLVCTKTCRLSAIKGKREDVDDNLDHGSDLIRQTINPDASIRGTAEAAGYKNRAVEQNYESPTAVNDEMSVRGTMMVSDTTAVPGTSGTPSGHASIALSVDEGAEFTARLKYVCQRLRRERQPVCPCNGILAILPFQIIKQGEAAGIEVQRAVKADLEKTRETLALRCPIIAMVSGMETEPGFRELVRRVGPKRAKQQRFGHGFNVWNPPIPDQLQALAANACKAFEDFTYMLFRERDGLTQYGNRKLYSLLCCIRSTLSTRLSNILVAAFADETSDPHGSGEALLFSGCYFAATGETEDQQAFSKSVIEKLADQQAELEWSDTALKEDNRFHQFAQTGLLLDGLLFFAAIGFGVALLRKFFAE